MKRKIGGEYLRILSMIFIISNHFLLFTGVLDSAKPFTLTFNLVWLLNAIGYVGTDCYVLLSGYFGVESTTTWKKIIRLWSEVIFYSITIYLVLVLTDNLSFSSGDFFKTLLPISYREYWFVTDFIGLYVLSPFINILLKNLDKRKFQKLIVIGIILFSILDALPGEAMYSQKGYSLYWLIVVYCVGAYIRLHGINISKPSIYVSYVGSVLIMYVVKLFGTFVSLKISPALNGYSTIFYCHSSIFVLIASVSLFLLFKDIKNVDSPIESIVLKVSPLTFGVYLIHMNPYLASLCWGGLKKIVNSEKITVLIWLIVSTLLIYVVCTCIEFVRKILFDKIARIYVKGKRNV